MANHVITVDDDALMLLDGRAGEKVQGVIEAVKRKRGMRDELDGLTDAQVTFLSALKDFAIREGVVIHQRISLRSCAVCGKTAGHAVHTRHSRYHRKGDKNYDRPLEFGGFEFIRSFVTFKGRAICGCCEACHEALLPRISKMLDSIDAEVPASITGHAPRFKKHTDCRCKRCGWTGHEGQMGQKRTMMGDGFYPATCPKCNAENGWVGTIIETLDTFTLVPAA